LTLYRPVGPDPESDDRKFAISAWSSSYKNSHFAGCITADDWPTVMHGQFGKIIDRPNTTTLVAYDRPSFLYGFICGDVTGPLPIVHYVYVKTPYRSERADDDGSHIGHRRASDPRHARGLFEALGVDRARPFIYTCRNSTVAEIEAAGKIPGGRFIPAALRYTNYQEQQHERRRRS
jgi:hypothetical protein